MKRVSRFLLCAAACVLFQISTAPGAFAAPILGDNLATFAILGGGGVTIGGTGSVIVGSVGAYPTTSITGVEPTNFSISGGTVQAGGGVAQDAHDELIDAMTFLMSGAMGTATNQPSLGGLTLAPGVYSSAAIMDLTGTLTLDGQLDGPNANPVWVFQVGSALNTASGSNVVVTGAGAGAGIYWVLPNTGGSASLGSNSTFAGNILALTSITVDTNVDAPCVRLLTQVASVTLAGDDNIGIGCGLGTGGEGSGGFDQGNPGGGNNQVPEPGTLLLMGTGIAGLIARRRVLAPKA